MAVQSVSLSTSESTSNLQAALSYITASCLQNFALGACGLFSLSLQEALANQAESLSCSFRILKKNVFLFCLVSFPGGLCDTVTMASPPVSL